MNCWKCGALNEIPANGKIAFRATCDKCYSWLHCCANCANYCLGLPNSCKIPGTEPVADREAANFCEDFHLKGIHTISKLSADDVAKKLFGEDPSSPRQDDPKKRFESLFD